MRVIAHMVVRNEAGRYLRSALETLRPYVDELVVFDDCSRDATVAIAQQHATACAVREPDEPSFAEDESRFRAVAWRYMEAVAEPEGGDWILAVDADEFLVCTDVRAGTREAIERAAETAQMVGLGGVTLPVPEVFGWDGQTPMVRVDGYWGGITAVRLVAWRPWAVFESKSLGGGSVPSYVADMGTSFANFGLNLLHFGYADQEDRDEKFRRYSNQPGQHNPEHIRSIIRPPECRRWVGSIPAVRRGQ